MAFHLLMSAQYCTLATNCARAYPLISPLYTSFYLRKLPKYDQGDALKTNTEGSLLVLLRAPSVILLFSAPSKK